MKIPPLLLLLIFSGCRAQHFVSSEAELHHALQKVKPGESITWKNGVYQNVKINFKPAAEGKQGKRIYLKAQTPGKVVFKGSSQLFLSGAYLQAEGFLFEGPSTLDSGANVLNFTGQGSNDHQTHNSIITNCAVLHYNIPADTIENKWVAFYGTNNELSFCSFIGKKNLGSTVVVVYQKPKGFKDGDTTCPSTYHRIHHNYFGPRTMPGNNDGEHIRIGDSKTSFTKGYNLVEQNYFEGHRNEPEVISNKSCYNTYRFNSFVNCDGALVLRHGNNCLVYGNYFNGAESQASGGIRIIGEDHIVAGNLIENVRGSNESLLKAGISIMSGLEGTPVNGYYQSRNIVVAFNRVSGCQTPCIVAGATNTSRKGVWLAPENIAFGGNTVANPRGKGPFFISNGNVRFSLLQGNTVEGWNGEVPQGFSRTASVENESLLMLIRSKTDKWVYPLSYEELSHFPENGRIKKEAAGVRWK